MLLDYEYSNFNSIYYEFGNFLGELKFLLTDTPPYFKYDKNNIHIN